MVGHTSLIFVVPRVSGPGPSSAYTVAALEGTYVLADDVHSEKQPIVQVATQQRCALATPINVRVLWMCDHV